MPSLPQGMLSLEILHTLGGWGPVRRSQGPWPQVGGGHPDPGSPVGVTMCLPQVPPSTPFQQRSLSCLGSPGVKVLGLVLPQLNSGQGRKSAMKTLRMMQHAP